MNSKAFELGYYASIFFPINYDELFEVKQHADECRNFIIGIPDNNIAARLLGDKSNYNALKIQNFIQGLEWVSDCIILDGEMLLYQNAYQNLHFDLCLYGTEYGKRFIEDLNFMHQHNVSFVPLPSSKASSEIRYSAIEFALNNVRKENKIILFGVGKFFKLYMKKYGDTYKPSYCVNFNLEDVSNTTYKPIPVFTPDKILSENADDILVIICGDNHKEIKDFLLQANILNYRIFPCNNNAALLEELGLAILNEKIYLEKIHKILLNMLNEFDRVCQKYNLRYYLTSGSLIGAIRHKGFIPWDDDIDLAMPQEDFNKLKEIAVNEWNGSDYQLVDFYQYGNNVFLDWIPRLIYWGEKVPVKAFDKISEKSVIDIKDRPFLDIFPLYTASNNQRKHIIYTTRLKILYNLFMGHRAYIDYSEYQNVPQKALRFMKVLHIIGRKIPFKLLIWRYKKLSNYSKNEKSNYYYRPSGLITKIDRKYEKDLFGDGKRIPFEDQTAMIPDNPSGLLNAQHYKNFMIPVKASKRKPSHYYNSDIKKWKHI